MSADLSIRVCPGCYKEIDRRARKCPYCQTYQGAYRTFVYGAAATFIGAVVLVLLAGIWWAETFQHRLRNLRPENCADQVVVKESRAVEVVETRFGPPVEGVAIVGIIENRGPLPIDSLQMEIQCFNSNGELIDSLSCGTSMLASQQRTSFKSTVSGVKPSSNIASHKVIVRTANCYKK